MGELNEQLFEQKLLSLKDSQESISALSSWCLKHHSHHKKIVAAWLRILKRVKIEQRLTLFYLANDVIQYSKRKGYEFVESWGTALQKATTMVRDDKVRNKILRLFKIWDERSIYDEAFLMDLSGLLSSNPKKPVSSDPAEFQPTTLFAKIRSCKTLEEDTDLKLKQIKEHPVDISDIKALNATLKVKLQVKSECDELSVDIDDGIIKMERYIKALEVEIKERTSLIDLLEASESYYETQRGEAKIVCNAYRNFGSRVKSLKRKLADLILTLPSPLPSPDVNAPSPSPESDIDLPDDNNGAEFYNPHMSNYTNYQSNQGFFPTESNNAYEATNFNSNDGYTYPLANDTVPFNASVPPPTTAAPMEDSSVLNNSSFSSFMGNFNLPLDIQKTLFKQDADIETPASPPIDQQIDELLDSPSNGAEGKPIEVISSTAKPNDLNFNVSEFLKSLMPTSMPDIGSTAPQPVPDPVLEIPVSQEVPMVPPPPMPPDVFFKEEFNDFKRTNGNKGWNSALPAKFPSWNQPNPAWEVSDTPSSPPTFEKESYVEPIEYNDTTGNMDSMVGTDRDDRRIPFKQAMKDTDHRLLDRRTQSLRGHKDVDHRNLISLTGSPKQDSKTEKKSNFDYKSIPMPPTPPSIPAIFDAPPPPIPAPPVPPMIPDISIPPPIISIPPPLTSIPPPMNSLPPPPKNVDNVESVDMEMSDDEDHASGKEASPFRSKNSSANTSCETMRDSPAKLDQTDLYSDIPTPKADGNESMKDIDMFSQTFEIPKPVNKALAAVVKDPSVDPILPSKDLFSPPVTPGMLLNDDDAQELTEINFSKSFLDETSAFLNEFDSQELLKDPPPIASDEQFPTDLLDGSISDSESVNSPNLQKRTAASDPRFRSPVINNSPVGNFNSVRTPGWQNSPRQFRPRFNQPTAPNQFRPNSRGFRPRTRPSPGTFRGRPFFSSWQ
nr:PREDICTED: uncharacterized protein LOC109033130 isoform X1 [Bemisia tabaci]